MAKTGLIKTVTQDKTGKVNIEYQHTKYMGGSEDNYIKFYLKDLMYLVGLSHYQYEVLYAVLKRADYKTNATEIKEKWTISLYKFVKEEIAEECGLTYGTVCNTISFLAKNDLLIPYQRGVYIPNPHLFGMGAWKDILSVRAEITWTPAGKNIKAIIQRSGSAK